MNNTLLWYSCYAVFYVELPLPSDNKNSISPDDGDSCLLSPGANGATSSIAVEHNFDALCWTRWLNKLNISVSKIRAIFFPHICAWLGLQGSTSHNVVELNLLHAFVAHILWMMPRNDVESLDHEVRKLTFPARACVQHRCTYKPNKFKAAAKRSTFFYLDQTFSPNILPYRQMFPLPTTLARAGKSTNQKLVTS